MNDLPAGKPSVFSPADIADPRQREWIESYQRRGWELYKVEGRSLEFLRRARGGNVRILSVTLDDNGNVQERERRETVELKEHSAQQSDNTVATSKPFESVDRLGWGRGIMCFCLAGFIGSWIASKNREKPWNAVKWCAVIFVLVFAIYFAKALYSASNCTDGYQNGPQGYGYYTCK